MSYFKTIWGDYFFSFLVLVFGIAGSLVFSWSYQQRWEERLERDFKEVARDRIEVVRGEIQHNDVVLRSLASLFLASDNVTHSEFQMFSKTLLMDSPFIASTAWIPVVQNAQRAEYEKQAEAWAPDYKIKELDKDGKLIPAAPRDTYLPLFYTEPQHSVTYLGFDYTTEPTRLASLELARQTRTAVASEKIKLLRDKQDAIIFAYPIFKMMNNANDGDLKGYALTIVPLAKLVASAIQPITPEGVNIVITDNSTTKEENHIIHTHSTRLKEISKEEILADYNAGDRLTEKSLIDVDGRVWEITVQSARGYFESSIPVATFSILGGGTCFSLLMFMFMFSRVRENARISERVYERTRELQQAKSKIETILFSANDGILGLDKNAMITFCNPMAAKLLGYTRQWDLRGQNYHALIAHTREDGEKYEIKDSAVSKALSTGDATTVSNEVFWKHDGTPLQTEYTVSPIIDENEVDGAVISFRDISERRAMEKKLEKMARYDQLTGLANRLLFVDQLTKSLARAKRSEKKVGVAYIDLNEFKIINDTMGHAAGDQLLKSFAERLNMSARQYDIPARVGGDEFTIVIDDLDDQQGGVKLLERLIENMKAPVTVGGKEIKLSGSIGIAFYPDDSHDVDELISHADKAMYKAKKNKSLPYVVYKSGT